MTNSTDKAAASAAIRVAPRRGRVRAGVVLDRDGVTVVQGITQDRMGWRIQTNEYLTWHLELADRTKLTRKAPVNLYIHR